MAELDISQRHGLQSAANAHRLSLDRRHPLHRATAPRLAAVGCQCGHRSTLHPRPCYGFHAKIQHQYPDFLLDHHHVIWDDAAFPFGQEGGVQHTAFLWRHYLLFKQSPTFTATGDIVLWDLSKGHFPLWRKPGETLLDVWGEMPRWDGGMAWWQAEGQATDAVYLPGTDTVWTFQYGPHVGVPTYYRYDWAVQTVGGRNVVVERSRSGIGWPASQPIFYVWHSPSAKGWLCR